MHELKGKTYEEIKAQAASSIKMFLLDTGSRTELWEAIDNLQIIEKSDGLNQVSPEKETKAILYDVICDIKDRLRPKHKWYDNETLQNIRKVIALYPDSHSAIIKFLNIPKATYYRLLRDPLSDKTRTFDLKRNKREAKRLQKEEKIYISRILEPPTDPITIDEI